jgi:hypothetical protein
VFPIQYIKISPIATFGTNFNYSIWYVEIKGIKEEDLMARVFNGYTKVYTIFTVCYSLLITIVFISIKSWRQSSFVLSILDKRI